MGPTGIGPVFGIVSPIAVQTEKGVNGDLGPIIPVKAELRQKEKLKANTAESVARGAFGAPTFFVGEDMFWGQDRLQFVEAALAS